MNLRHEVKCEIGYQDLCLLRSRLRVVARPDPHAASGSYLVRSLYFDDVSDSAYFAKLNGVSRRDKYRIRYYDSDTSFIRLEKKSKYGELGCKNSAALSKEEVQRLLCGDADWMADRREELIIELYHRIKSDGFAPKAVVEYRREPYVYPAGNVRVTLDSDIRAGLRCTDFLDPKAMSLPVTDMILLELKWDNYLPDVIRDAVGLRDRHRGSFSKYTACRIYG